MGTDPAAVATWGIRYLCCGEAGEVAAGSHVGKDQRWPESPARSEKRIAEKLWKSETVKQAGQKPELSGRELRIPKGKAVWRNDVQISFPGLCLNTSPCCQSHLSSYPGWGWGLCLWQEGVGGGCHSAGP